MLESGFDKSEALEEAEDCQGDECMDGDEPVEETDMCLDELHDVALDSAEGPEETCEDGGVAAAGIQNAEEGDDVDASKWRCPVAGCGHVMKRGSAGRRAHMIRRHAALCALPCKRKCSHGCKVCVPESTLNDGRSAIRRGVVLKRPAASALKDPHVDCEQPDQPAKCLAKAKKARLGSKESSADLPAASSASPLPNEEAPASSGSPPPTEDTPASSAGLPVPKDYTFTLEAAELMKLMRTGADKESVLRGVCRAKQLEVLELLRKPAPGAPGQGASVAVDYEVSIGLEAVCVEQVEVDLDDAYCKVAAATYGADWPSGTYTGAPPLQRVGPDDCQGLGPEDAFTLGVVVGPSGSGVTQMLRKLAQDLKLPRADPAHFRTDQAVASCFEDAVSMLPRVGLNSIPAWMRPYHVLSNGQQQRVRLAKGLTDGAVIDDFGSGIDEQEAHSVAHAIGKFIRQQGMSRVLIGSHNMDVVRYLQPDFVLFVTGQWSVNPNPWEGRGARVRLEPSFMGKLHQDGDAPSDKYTPYEHVSRMRDSGAMRLCKRALEVTVETDERVTDAANAFEVDFDGVARCLIPVLPREEIPIDWKIGVIVGPSGTGKTMTLKSFEQGAQALQGGDHGAKWPLGHDVAVFTHVATSAGCAHEAAKALHACCVPVDCWLRGPPSLSRSEAWRAQLACQLAAVRQATRARPLEGTANEQSSVPMVIADEFTTQLDRPHARALCESLGKYVCSMGVRLLCATVHRDIVSWLHPCWILDTEHSELTCSESFPADTTGATIEHEPLKMEAYVGPEDTGLWESPALTFEVRVVADTSVKPLWTDRIKHHHYLSHSLKSTLQGGTCVALERNSQRLAAFHASSMLPGARTCVRECRLVVLPEWQGFGIGPRLSNFLAARWIFFFKEQGYLFSSMTAHPRLGELRQSDRCWQPCITNLRRSKTEFGKIGDFGGDKDKTPTWTLPHGTVLRILHKNKRVCVNERAQPDVEIDFRIPSCAEKEILDSCGICLECGTLNVASLTGRAAECLQDVPPGLDWAIVRINANTVASFDDLCKELRAAGRVATFAFRVRCTSEAERMGPCRDSLKEASCDLEWIRVRCVAQCDLKSEVRHVCQLLSALRRSAGQVPKRTGRPKKADAAINISLKEKVVRPDFPELPSDVLPALLEAITEASQSKPRITYSHVFVGHLDAGSARAYPIQAAQEQYQAWMKVRVPEWRKAGKTHQGSIQASIEEFGQNGLGLRVLEFDWSSLKAMPSQMADSTMSSLIEPECDGPASLLNPLGIHLVEGAVISHVTDLVEDVRGLTVTAFAQCRSMQRVMQIISVRRGAHKLDIASLEELANAFDQLQTNGAGNRGLLYVAIQDQGLSHTMITSMTRSSTATTPGTVLTADSSVELLAQRCRELGIGAYGTKAERYARIIRAETQLADARLSAGAKLEEVPSAEQ